MPERTSIQKWNFLRENSLVRGAISFKRDERGLTNIELGELIGVDPHKVRRYFNCETPNLNNYEIVSLAKKLGLDLDISIKIDNSIEGVP